MKVDRRATAVLTIVAVIAIPAAVLRTLCVGRSCDQEQQATRNVPFCSLPARTRSALAAGFRDGRSPDVMAVTRAGIAVVSKTPDGAPVEWPSTKGVTTGAGLSLSGAGIDDSSFPSRFDLTDLGPTLGKLTEVPIPHPDVRSGRPVAGVSTTTRPTLVVLVAARATPRALSGFDSSVESMRALPESLPSDPAAVLTTIGTGGIPAEHGITGTHVRNEGGEVAAAWSLPAFRPERPGFRARPPLSVIATFADDLDDTLDQQPKVGLVADTFQARGLMGGTWYVDRDRDDVRIVSTAEVLPAARRMLARGYGDDRVPDLLGVSLRVTDRTAAARLRRWAARIAGPKVLTAVVVLPESKPPPSAIPAREIERSLTKKLGRDVVEVATAGGLFLDQEVLAEAGVTRDDVVRALDRVEHEGETVFADVFPSLAVAFARFC
jgi:hypothetical protein